MRYCLFLLLFLSSFLFPAAAQNTIRVKGTVYDPDNKGAIPNLMIVNKRTQQGFFGYNSGEFDMELLHSDTLIIAATGFSTRQITFRDSIYVPVYVVRIPLKRLQV